MASSPSRQNMDPQEESTVTAAIRKFSMSSSSATSIGLSNTNDQSGPHQIYHDSYSKTNDIIGRGDNEKRQECSSDNRGEGGEERSRRSKTTNNFSTDDQNSKRKQSSSSSSSSSSIVLSRTGGNISLQKSTTGKNMLGSSVTPTEEITDTTNDVMETNVILSNHIQTLQNDCNIMSDILDRVDTRLQTIEKKSQPLVDLVKHTSTSTTTTNALLCRLEAIDAYIASLQDIIDVQHTEIQQLGKKVAVSNKSNNKVIEKDDSSNKKSSDPVVNDETRKATSTQQQQALLEKLQGRFVQKACTQVDLIAQLQDENEVKDVQIKALQDQLQEIHQQQQQQGHNSSGTGNGKKLNHRRLFSFKREE